MFFIANLARYAIGADLAPVMRAQVSGLETSSERKCVAVSRPVACISVEEGAKKGHQARNWCTAVQKRAWGPAKSSCLVMGPKLVQKPCRAAAQAKKGDLEVALRVEFVCAAAGRAERLVPPWRLQCMPAAMAEA